MTDEMDKPQGGDANDKSQGDKNGQAQGASVTTTTSVDITAALKKIEELERDNKKYRDERKVHEATVLKQQETRLEEEKKWQELAETRAQALAKAETRAAELEAARITDKVNGAIKDAAAKAKNRDHVLNLIRIEHADKVAALVNDKGEVDSKAAEALVNEFSKENPDYFAGAGGPGSPSNRGGKTPDANGTERAAAAMTQFRRVTGRR